MIRVLVVDDSAVLRQSLQLILESDVEMKVVGEAASGEEAITLTKRLRPDVVTMDIRMPHMNGLDAIRYIMAECPVPIVVVTSLDLDQDGGISVQAAKLGALSILRRPASIDEPGYNTFTARLIEQVKIMSDVKVVHRSRVDDHVPDLDDDQVKPTVQAGEMLLTQAIAIGASTGGPAALHKVLSALPEDFGVPILVVQHITFGFVDGLAEWLNDTCSLSVKVAEQGDAVRGGWVYLAPDDRHMQIDSQGHIVLIEEAAVNGHRPSITVLFESLARAYGKTAMAILLTGMGADGAAGMKLLREAGTTTIAQDEKSCVVFGMPKEAITLGAVEHVVPLERIAQTMVALVHKPADD